MTDTDATPQSPAIPTPPPEAKSRRGRPKGRKNGKKYTFSKPMEYISEIRRAQGRKSGGKPGHSGRDLGGHHADTICPGEKRVIMMMPQSVRDTINICAKFDGIPAIELMNRVAGAMRADARYAHLFLPQA